MPTYDPPYLVGETYEKGGETVPLGVVELRVHGVNGGTAEANLQDPHPIRVSGTEIAGFYRRRPQLNHEQEAAADVKWPRRGRVEPLPEPERTVEAYNWSNINSRRKGRAWWVFLFPYAAANLAGYLLPKGLSSGRRSWARALLRLLAVAGTVATLIGVTFVAVDLVAVQCGGSVSCTDRAWLGWLDTVAGWGDLRTSPTRRAVIFTAVPVLVLGALWFLGRRGARYEDYGALEPPDGDAHGPRVDRLRLGDEAFWRAPDAVYVLTWLHVTAGLAALSAVVAFALIEMSGSGGHRNALLALGGLAAVVLAVAGVGVVLYHRLRQIPPLSLRRAARLPFLRRPLWVLAAVAATVLVAVAVVGWLAPDAAHVPPLDAVRNALVGSAFGGVALVAATGVVVGAVLPFAAAVGVGALVVALIWTRGDELLIGGSPWLWIGVEALVAVAAVAIYEYTRRGELKPSDRRNDPVLIYTGLALVAVAGIAAVYRGAWWPVAMAVPVVYLGAQFVVQVSRGHDLPASEEMRVGIAAVMGGLGITAVLTIVGGVAIFVAQRLGSDVAYDRGPTFPPGVQATVEADTLTLGVAGMTVEGRYLPAADRDLTTLRARMEIDLVEFSGRVEPADSDQTLVVSGGPDEVGAIVGNRRLRGAMFEVDEAVGRVRAVSVFSDAGEASGRYAPAVGDTVDIDDLFGTVEEGRAVLEEAVVEFRPEGILLDGTPRIFYPAELGWYAVAAVGGFIVLLAGAVLRVLVLGWSRWRGKWEDLDAEYDAAWQRGGHPPGAYDLEDPGRRERFARRAARHRWLANLTDDADWLISSAVYTTVALVAAIAVARFTGGQPTERESNLIGMASLAIAFAGVGLYLLVRKAEDDQGLRRTIGLVWDVTSFFPRRFHPLAPPCYAEQAVLDLRNRIIQVRRSEPEAATGKALQPDRHGRLLILAHSEGTLLTAAALLTLTAGTRRAVGELPEGHEQPSPGLTELDGVMWVTYGCMLRRLFSRAWPTMLPLRDLIRLKARLEGVDPGEDPAAFPCPARDRVPRWIDFGRYSDYLGGRVFAEIQRKPTDRDRCPEAAPERCDDVFFGDPVRRWRQWGQFGHARRWTHSFNYQSDMEDPRFRRHVRRAGWVLTDPALEKFVLAPHPEDCICVHA